MFDPDEYQDDMDDYCSDRFLDAVAWLYPDALGVEGHGPNAECRREWWEESDYDED